MPWNHRIIKEGDILAIHEVYYNEDGSLHGYTENPVAARGDNLEELKQYLKWMKKALNKPILTDEDFDNECNN